MVSSVSRLAVLTSSLVPALRLNALSERLVSAFHSPSAGPLRQPTRLSSFCTDLPRSACGPGPGVSAATSVGLLSACCGGAGGVAAGATAATTLLVLAAGLPPACGAS